MVEHPLLVAVERPYGRWTKAHVEDPRTLLLHVDNVSRCEVDQRGRDEVQRGGRDEPADSRRGGRDEQDRVEPAQVDAHAAIISARGGPPTAVMRP
jgi:hypothetical protein